MIEWFAIWAYLDFRLLSVGIDLSLVGYQLAFLGERLDFQDFSFAGLGLQSGLYVRGEGIKCDLFFDFDDGAIRGHGDILAVAIDGPFRFVDGLAGFFFGG